MIQPYQVVAPALHQQPKKPDSSTGAEQVTTYGFQIGCRYH